MYLCVYLVNASILLKRTRFPSVTPVTAESMNWGCLLFGFMVGFSAIYYVVKGRHEYISPKERVHRELQGI